MARRVAFTLPATTEINNRFSAGGTSLPNIGNNAAGTAVASGVGTAGALATVLTINGSGYVPFLIAYSNSATPSHTIRCKVFVDGVSVFDATSDTIATTALRGMSVVDCVPSATTSTAPTGVPIRFNYSFVVQVASSQSGTDYVAIRYEYQKTAS